MFSNIRKYFNNFCKIVYTKIQSIGYFFKFINIIYYITNKDLSTLNYQETNKLKLKIINNGMVPLKFMQWYISRLENEDSIKYQNLVKEFESIFDDCPFHSLNDTKEIFENDYKVSLEEYLDLTTLKEIGSGSIGQVYKCKTYDNKEVAFKVKHPEIEKQKTGQFWVIKSIIFFQKFNFIKNRLNLHFDVKDFSDNLLLQLDFGNEALNCLKFGKNYKNNNLVIIPKIYYYSNNTIIQSYEEGIELDELSIGDKQRSILNMYCFLNQMIMIDNWIHGDFHKKNWKVRKNENNSFSSIVIYDFGLCFSSDSVEDNRTLWKSFEDNKLENVCEFVNILINGKLNENDNEEIKMHLNNIFERPFNIQDILEKLLSVIKDKNLVINKYSLNIILLATLIEKLLIDSKMIESDIDYTNDTLRIDKVQARKADILSFCKTTNTYPELYEYINEDYKNMKICNLFNTDNSNLDFDDIEF